MEVVLTVHTEDKSAIVPLAQQAEAVHPVWRWAKPCVWTTRMLTALIKGVEGGLFFAEQGLFSLATAHASVCQSSRR